jgi:hypothetical protein
MTPVIPTVNELQSDRLVHSFGDVFSPPGITNFWGGCQADLDITGVRSLNFPPFTNSDRVTGSLFLDGWYFPAHNRPIAFTWYPDKIVRETEFNGLQFRSETILPFGKTTLVIRLAIVNTRPESCDILVKFGAAATITRNMGTGKVYVPPLEEDNRITIDESRRAVLFQAVHSEACSLQGMYPPPDNVNGFGIEKRVKIAAGGMVSLYYLNVIAGETDEAFRQFDSLAHEKIAACFAEHEQAWNHQIAAVFTPGNSEYSGFLPTLSTADREIARLYDTAAIGLIYFRRDNPFSVYGRAYDTLMPRYWQGTTFIWDYFISSGAHALLDPAVMRKYIELWMQTDVHTHFGTEYLTGGTVGPWYAVNDFALTWLVGDYLRWNGDFAWLDQAIAGSEGRSGKKIIDYLKEYATNYRQFRTASGLADYGGINNLLECVSTYIHEVASLNAGNIFSLRTLAEILHHHYHDPQAGDYLQEARELLQELMKLYADGRGFWNARFPDGSLVEVRHGYDFMTILTTIADDLSPRQKEEMVRFFAEELQTPVWMRALSPRDPNAMFSVRPDHQWNGAYTAWPALAAAGLFRVGRGDLAVPWLQGVARSANQGPFGQCHFVEAAMPPESGGALKAFYEWPYGADWACSSSGSYVTAVIEGLFGVQASRFAGISAHPQFAGFDPGAELHNLRYRDGVYNVTRHGLTKTR